MRKHCWSMEVASSFGIDSGSEAADEWMNLVVKSKHQLAPSAELSDAPREDLGHQRLGEEAVLVVLDYFEGLEHGLTS